MSRANPFEVLGVEETANDAQIADAYRRAVLAHPPDRDPEGFQRVREAYEAVRDEDARLELRLFGPAPLGSFSELLEGLDAPKRPFLGPGPWIAFLKEMAR